MAGKEQQKREPVSHQTPPDFVPPQDDCHEINTNGNAKTQILYAEREETSTCGLISDTSHYAAVLDIDSESKSLEPLPPIAQITTLNMPSTDGERDVHGKLPKEGVESKFENTIELETSEIEQHGSAEDPEYDVEALDTHRIPISSQDDCEPKSIAFHMASPATGTATANVPETPIDESEPLGQASTYQKDAQESGVQDVGMPMDSVKLQSPCPAHATEVSIDCEPLPPGDTGLSPLEMNSSETAPVEFVIGDESGNQLQKLDFEQIPRATTSLRTQLDSDTAILQAYLNRKQADKPGGLQADSIARRTSLEYRRDSDAVRQALASPRMVLEEKNVNSPTPGRPKNPALESARFESTTKDTDDSKDFETSERLQTDAEQATPTRRSMRRRSGIPPPSSRTSIGPPTSVSVRSGAESVVLKRSDAQATAIVTRANTRKNKGTALQPKSRLAKLKVTVSTGAVEESKAEGSEKEQGGRSIEWADPLVQGMLSPEKNDFGESTSMQQEDMDEQPFKPRIRRLRRPGNGTPAKGLLTTAQLPPEVESSAIDSAKNVGDARPMRLPSPKKLKFTVANEGKDNHSVAPKKSGIPVGTGTTATRASGRKRASGVQESA